MPKSRLTKQELEADIVAFAELIHDTGVGLTNVRRALTEYFRARFQNDRQIQLPFKLGSLTYRSRTAQMEIAAKRLDLNYALSQTEHTING